MYIPIYSSDTLYVHSGTLYRGLPYSGTLYGALAPYMYILAPCIEGSTFWHPICSSSPYIYILVYSSGTLYVHLGIPYVFLDVPTP